MNLADLTQLSVAGLAVVMLGYGFKMFLKHLSKRDDQFTDILQNHMAHNTESNNKLTESNVKMTSMIDQLLRFLEKSNGKN